MPYTRTISAVSPGPDEHFVEPRPSRADLRSAVVLALVLVLLTSLASLLLAIIGGLVFPHEATGSIIERDGRKVGSELVGQRFEGDHYVHGRPSAVDHDPMKVGGSNLAPSNPALRERALAEAERIAAREGVAASAVPLDLLTTSGSGIDPHISPAAARLQVARVARARGIAPALVEAAIARHTEGRTFGLLGEARVHVLRLNLDLDHQHPRTAP
jgi:K+-transporting ATPase ATPase C chain